MNPVRYYNKALPDIAAKDYRSKPFDNSADGTGQGEGVLAFVLQPLSEAMKQKREIYAVIKGSSINNDGASVGITAPNKLAQQEVISEAWKNAEIEPESITYVECHGTGTKLGDPIELESLSAVFAKYTKRKQFCGVGSVKSNYGHLDSAAGLLGLLKCIISLTRKKLYPNIHFKAPNEKINFVNSPLYVVSELADWKTDEECPRRCGLSSFGLGGTNCHVVLEEAPALTKPIEDRQWDYLLFSAKTEQALLHYIHQYILFLNNNRSYSLNEICESARTTRERYEWTLIIVANSINMLISQLQLARTLPIPCVHSKGILIGSSSSLAIEKKELDQAIPEAIKTAIWEMALSPTVDKDDIKAEILYKHIPTYPFEKRCCSIDFSKLDKNAIQTEKPQQEVEIDVVQPNQYESQLKAIIYEIFEIPIHEQDECRPFVEMGLDSITIILLKQKIQQKYQVDIPADAFFNELNCIREVSLFLNKEIEKEVDSRVDTLDNCERVTSATLVDTSIRNSTIEELMERQLKIIECQLSLLASHKSKDNCHSKLSAEKEEKTLINVPDAEKNPLRQKYFVKTSQKLSDKQIAYLSDFVSKYEQKTRRSKQMAEKCRPVWANGRMSQGFDQMWKQLIYPVFFAEGHGCHMK